MGADAAQSQTTGRGADWWRGAVIYQIYPRSFRDTNGDGVGDLRGVLEKLDYVASLGVDGIWLSPFYRSPMKDFGYDVSDYCDVDPLFGTLSDFDTVLRRAHALGLKVIIDQVWSHTSNRHPWFVESATSRDNPKAAWYVWADAKPDGSPPNNWQATFGGASWTWNPRRRQYYLHNFLSEQPDLNYWNPAVQEAILDVARFWLDRGVDGFRLDVINYIFHDRRLTDNPPANANLPPATTVEFQRHIHDRSQPEALDFLSKIRALTDAYDARMMVGEVFDDAMLARQQDYTATPGRLHTAYSFFLLYAPAAMPDLFAEALRSWAQAPGWPSWSLGNHDVPRVASRLAKGGRAHADALMAVLLCLRGTIFLYQGEELGLPQADVPFEKLQDPFAIAAYTGESGRDGARTPMPWTQAGPSSGFSAGAETWLPVDERHRALAVDAQEPLEASALNVTRRLIRARRASSALQVGDAVVRDAAPGVLAFERRTADERVLCVFELAGQAATELAGAPAALLASVNGGRLSGVGEVVLPPFGGVVLRLDPTP